MACRAQPPPDNYFQIKIVQNIVALGDRNIGHEKDMKYLELNYK